MFLFNVIISKLLKHSNKKNPGFSKTFVQNSGFFFCLNCQIPGFLATLNSIQQARRLVRYNFVPLNSPKEYDMNKLLLLKCCFLNLNELSLFAAS